VAHPFRLTPNLGCPHPCRPFVWRQGRAISSACRAGVIPKLQAGISQILQDAQPHPESYRSQSTKTELPPSRENISHGGTLLRIIAEQPEIKRDKKLSPVLQTHLRLRIPRELRANISIGVPEVCSEMLSAVWNIFQREKDIIQNVLRAVERDVARIRKPEPLEPQLGLSILRRCYKKTRQAKCLARGAENG
jgi:hypothetical protein